MTPPSPIQTLLTQWREAAEKATPGPWQAVYSDTLADSKRIFAGQSRFIASVGNSDETKSETANNASFIALSRTALPTAIEMIEVLRAGLEGVEIEAGMVRRDWLDEQAKKGAPGIGMIIDSIIRQTKAALSTLQTLAERKP